MSPNGFISFHHAFVLLLCTTLNVLCSAVRFCGVHRLTKVAVVGGGAGGGCARYIHKGVVNTYLQSPTFLV